MGLGSGSGLGLGLGSGLGLGLGLPLPRPSVTRAASHAQSGIPLPCTELHTPSAASPRGPHDNVKFNMMSSPPADRAHLACQEESGACATWLSPFRNVSPFLNRAGASAADHSSTRSCRPVTEIACRLRDVGWDPSHRGTPCAAPSVRTVSGARHTCLSRIRQRGSSRCPASGQLEEVMWGCRGCVL